MVARDETGFPNLYGVTPRSRHSWLEAKETNEWENMMLRTEGPRAWTGGLRN